MTTDMETSGEMRAVGFDIDAAAIIQSRLLILKTHTTVWATDDRRWQCVFLAGNGKLRKELLENVEGPIQADPESAWTERLSRLAQDFGLAANVEHSTLVRCLSNGWLDVPIPGKRQRSRPKIENIAEIFFAVLRTYQTVEQRAAALIEAKLCGDMSIARLAAREFLEKHTRRKMSNRICAILSAWGRYDKIGLLHFSSYRFYEELRLVEDYLLNLPSVTRPSEDVIACARGDIIAVCTGLFSLGAKDYKLYHQHLWTEPPNSSNRLAYKKRLFPRLRSLVIGSIATARECDMAEAELLFNRHVDGGIPAIFDGRWSESTRGTLQSAEAASFMSSVREITHGIDVAAQEEIVRLAAALFQALQNTGIQFSRVPVIKEYPSSRRRRSWGRRLSFGVPAIVRRRQERRRLHRELRPRLVSSTDHLPQQPSLEDRLINEFGRLAMLPPKEAADRLRNVLTSGAPGFVPRSHWYQLFDNRLLTWLRLIRFGHPERSLEWSRIYQGASLYTKEIGIVVPSSQLLKAIYNSMPKPRHWHGGKGIVLIRVHQRTPRVITDRPRLHAAWFLVWFTLKLDVIDEFGASSNSESHMLLVGDEETELPIGGWLSVNQPGSREVGLALYQAIWHPGMASWPLRGVPDVIRIPKVLLPDGNENLTRGASRLLTNIEITETSVLKGKKRAQKLVNSIRQQGTADVTQALGTRPVPADRALQILFEGLAARSFPHHRQRKPPLSIRENLVAMPGHDTPAAGWMLPIMGMAETTEAGVCYNGREYADSNFQVTPRQQLPCRVFPRFYPTEELFGTRPGIFVEVIHQGATALHYLMAQP
jgi:hypothetical protein